MQAQEAARIFHDWASIEGMLPEGPVTSVQITNAEKALISPVTDLGKQVLRTKQILSVGFNEAASEIVVFTKRAAPTTKRHKASLPQKIENVSIVYRQGVQNPVGPDSLPFSGPTATRLFSCKKNIPHQIGRNFVVGDDLPPKADTRSRARLGVRKNCSLKFFFPREFLVVVREVHATLQ